MLDFILSRRMSVAAAFTEEHILKRQKQIDLVYASEAYKNFAKNNPGKKLPRAPDPSAPDSKRQFEGRIKAWKRQLSGTADNEYLYIKGPVTLYPRNPEDLQQCEEIKAMNPPNSVKIHWVKETLSN